MYLSGREVELPDGGDPLARQHCQGKLLGQVGRVIRANLREELLKLSYRYGAQNNRRPPPGCRARGRNHA